ncbi:hypothetical protein PT2222_270093 [Paraburkholderia tropica]
MRRPITARPARRRRLRLRRRRLCRRVERYFSDASVRPEVKTPRVTVAFFCAMRLKSGAKQRTAARRFLNQPKDNLVIILFLLRFAVTSMDRPEVRQRIARQRPATNFFS